METEIPPAPVWPDAEKPAVPPPATPATDSPEESAASATSAPVERVEDPTRVEDRTPPPPAAVPPPAPAREAPPASASRVNVPLTLPVMLSGWLIGGGALVAALGVLIGMFTQVNVIDLLLLLLLLGIAATVFFSASLPAMPHLRLATLVVVLIGLGVAIDRIGFGVTGGGGLLLFLGVAAAAIGAILLEIGRDQPMGSPRA